MSRPHRWPYVLATLALLGGTLVSSRNVAPAEAATSTLVTEWTEPGSGFSFLDAAVMGATSSIDMSMYELSDPTMERDLIARAKSGVHVAVLLNRDYTGLSANGAAFAALRAGGVDVRWAPASTIYHAKYLIIDNRRAYIGTGNLTAQYYSSTRDFWVEDTNPTDVRAIATTFAHDDAMTGAAPVASPGLVWSPGSTTALVNLINNARHSLIVENEEMKSAPIEQALINAAHRGVDVKVVMTYSSSWASALATLAQAGVHVSQLSVAQIYIHAKVMCADCDTSHGTVFLGSENFSTSSLSWNRELGVITVQPSIIAPVLAAITHDDEIGIQLSIGPTTTSTPGTPGALTVTSFLSAVHPGQEDTLSVRAPSAGASCTLGITLPSGDASASKGLGPTTATASGVATWTWKIGTSTGGGTATATITCGGKSLKKTFSIS